MDNINGYIDHTLLKADASKQEIIQLCEEAKIHHFATVCVNPSWVETASKLLNGSSVGVCTVIGFPLGSSTTETKVFECLNAISNGANEIDMVINIGALKDGHYSLVENDIRKVIQSTEGKVITKVIIETSYLTDEEKVIACEMVVSAGADFVKTSTGFTGKGATIDDISLMRKTVGPHIGVKASGGVRSPHFARELIKAGATRLGTSSGVSIVNGTEGYNEY